MNPNRTYGQLRKCIIWRTGSYTLKEIFQAVITIRITHECLQMRTKTSLLLRLETQDQDNTEDEHPGNVDAYRSYVTWLLTCVITVLNVATWWWFLTLWRHERLHVPHLSSRSRWRWLCGRRPTLDHLWRLDLRLHIDQLLEFRHARWLSAIFVYLHEGAARRWWDRWHSLRHLLQYARHGPGSGVWRQCGRLRTWRCRGLRNRTWQRWRTCNDTKRNKV